MVRTRKTEPPRRIAKIRSKVAWAAILVGAGGVVAAAAELSGNNNPSTLTVGLWGTVAVLAVIGAIVQYRHDAAERAGTTALDVDIPPNDDSAPCQLPSDIDDFTGRQGAAAALNEFFTDWRTSKRRALPVYAISGKGGVGKTAFAVHVAHRMRVDCPDGQLYVNLRGAEASPLAPGSVLNDFLRSIGVDGTAIPAEVDARAALFRAKLEDKRVLLLLDNATGESQVRPLLPGTSSCAVIVTSRRPMVGLEGAGQMSLDVMDQESSRALLVRILGPERVDREPDASDELVRLCGYLPLAIRVAAGRLLAKPHWSIADYVDRLRRQRQRLSELRHGDLDVRASLRLSFDALPEDDQNSFTRLGLLRAREFGVWPIAALLACDRDTAADFIERMVEAQLIDVLGRDLNGHLRYQLHDLVQEFAMELAVDLPDEERKSAIERLAGVHLFLIAEAEKRFQPGEIRIVGDAPRWGDADLAAAELHDAVGWFTVERSALVVMVEYAFEQRLWSATWEIAHALAVFFEMRAHWDEWTRTHELALAAAREQGSDLGVAAILIDLAALHRDKAQSAAALRSYRQSFELFRRIGDRHGMGISLLGLGLIYRNERRWRQSERRCRLASEIMRETGDERLTAQSLRSLAIVLGRQDKYDEAESNFLEAGRVFASLGDRRGEAYNWRGLGDLYRRKGTFESAADCYQRSAQILVELVDRRGEARAIQGLGRVYLAAGDSAAAADQFRRALDMVQGLGDATLETSLRRDVSRLPS